MLELMDYLREHDFQVWICSGGTADFMRGFAPSTYGVRPEQIIGTGLKQDSRTIDGRRVVWRLAEPESLNDKEVKPVNIDRQIGRRPLVAVGNVGNAGDIAMLEYSQGRAGPSFQMLVNHDDPDREFAYAERDNTSLNAARRQGFTVVSIRRDWGTLFSGR